MRHVVTSRASLDRRRRVNFFTTGESRRRLRRRALFLRFATSMIVLSFASVVVFFAYPSAPPWAASQAGVLQGVVKLPPVNDVSSLWLRQIFTVNRPTLRLSSA